MTVERSQVDRGFWLRWVGASTFGGAVGFVVGLFVVFATGALWKAVAWAEGLAVC